jgi:APA family basic amino acid/polyamine antiporter
MSRDGLLPASLASVHKTFKTPWINTIIVGVAACFAAGFMSLDVLGDLANVGSLAAFTLVCVTVIYLRFSSPGLERPFKTPFFPITPILGAIMCIVLLMSLMAVTITRNFFLTYLAGGILIYFAYGIWNSKLGKGIVVDGHDASPQELPPGE